MNNKTFSTPIKLTPQKLDQVREKIAKETPSMYRSSQPNTPDVSVLLHTPQASHTPSLAPPSTLQKSVFGRDESSATATPLANRVSGPPAAQDVTPVASTITVDLSSTNDTPKAKDFVTVREPQVSTSVLSKKSLEAKMVDSPYLDIIAKRTVNKELVTKKVLINILLLLSSRLLINIVALAFAYILVKLNLADAYYNAVDEIQYHAQGMLDYVTWNNAALLLQGGLMWNVTTGIYQLLKPEDKFEDLPLTPAQRELLGLPIVATPVESRATPVKLAEKPVLSTTTKLPPPTPLQKQLFSDKMSMSTGNVKRMVFDTPLKNEVKKGYIPSPKYAYMMDSPSPKKRF